MNKLTFYYGVMGSRKTAWALMQNFSYKEDGKNVVFLKSILDNRDGEDISKSRNGMSTKAIPISQEQRIIDAIGNPRKLNLIIVDEAQFLTKKQVEELKKISSTCNVPVEAYGLKDDFKGEFFEGSEALFHLSEELIQLKKECSCGNTAIRNVRYNGETGEIIKEGPQVLIAGDDQYASICYECLQIGYVRLNGAKKKQRKINKDKKQQ